MRVAGFVNAENIVAIFGAIILTLIVRLITGKNPLPKPRMRHLAARSAPHHYSSLQASP